MYQRARKFFGMEAREIPEASEWHKQNELTPDLWKLEQSQYQLIFICDDMMRGKQNNALIAEVARDGDIPVHPACFTLEKFTLWRKDLGVESYSVPLPKDYNPSNWVRCRPTSAKIKGQLYAILSPAIKTLDSRRQNGLQFVRSRQRITLPYTQLLYNQKNPIPKFVDCIHTVEAWMYQGIPEYWDTFVGDMFQVRECPQFEMDQPKFWIDRYYKFE